jgi:tetratricopeptide (TPR) repeat protein
VRFDASNMDSWRYWTLGLRQTSDLQQARGEIANAIATLQSLFALKQDKRLPASLGPTVAFNWIRLVYLQADAGNGAAAAQSLKSYVHDSNEFIAQLDADDSKRALVGASQRGMGGVLPLFGGEPQAALAIATGAIAATDAIKVPASDLTAVNMQTAILQTYLGDAARAAIMLGRYPQAEALSRRALKMPRAPFDTSDPRDTTSAFAAVLAHALARQGHKDEAVETLQPALAYYRELLQAGAHDTNFRRDYAYALYADAIAQPAGASRRATDLKEAAAQVDGASDEAQRLASMRFISGLIAAERGK